MTLCLPSVMKLSPYAEGMAAKVLLPGESLATHAAGEGPLPCVTTNVPLHDSLLLGSVRAERTLVEFYRHYQTITCRGCERVKKWLQLYTGNEKCKY